LKLVFVIFKISLLLFEVILCSGVVLTSLVDELISLSGVLDGLLPLEVELMSLRMESFEFFGGLIKLNLGSLSFGNFSFKFVGFSCNFDGKFFNLECKLLDFGLICSSILLKGEVILFLLSGSKGPLLELLLIPIHLKLELIHLLVSLEDHVLDIV